MIKVQTLDVNGHVCYQVTNTVNGKTSFIPFEEDVEESLWHEVKSILRYTQPKKHYKHLRIIANMALDSNLPEEVPIVVTKTKKIEEKDV